MKNWKSMIQYKFNFAKPKEKELSFKPSRWCNYLFGERHKANGRLSRGIRTLDSFMKTESWNARQANGYDPDIGWADNADNVYGLAERFSKELFSWLYEDPKKVQNEIEWVKQANEIISQITEFESIREDVKGDADFSGFATAQILSDCAYAIAKIYAELEVRKTQDSEPETSLTPEQKSDFRKALRSAIGKAKQTIDNAKQNMAQFDKASAGNMNGVHHIGQGAERTKLIEMFMDNRKFKEIMRKAGRLLETMDGLPGISKMMKDEIHEIGYGDDLPMVLQCEKRLLASPVTENIFYLKYIKKDLMQLELKGVEKLGRGNVFVLVDESGSMEGERNYIAKSLAAAMAITCKNHGREFTGIMFDNRVDRYYKIGKTTASITCQVYKKTTELPPNEAIAHMVNGFANGGTCFNAPFSKALNLGAMEQNADIVFITDGEGTWGQDVNKKLVEAKSNGLRIFTILIGCSMSAQISEMSDYMIDIEGMADEQLNESIASVVKESCKKN